jgi:hypothetical protein
MFTWPNLDPRTRDLMLDEIAHDIARSELYISKASGLNYFANFLGEIS